MRIKATCTTHKVALRPYDGGPFLIPVGETELVGSDYAPKSGEWEVDLSNMSCPGQEAAGFNEETDEWNSPCEEDDSWVIGYAPEPGDTLLALEMGE
jgi:hypothetical protein